MYERTWYGEGARKSRCDPPRRREAVVDRHRSVLVAVGVVALALLMAAAIHPARARAASNIAFADASLGWRITFEGDAATGGKAIAWRTLDGGDTWTRLATKAPGFTSGGGYTGGLVAFADAHTGLWGRYYALRFLRTTNGGTSWRATGRGFGQMLWDFSWASRRVAWACTGVGSADDGGTICKSSDRGKTWRILKSAKTRPGHLPAGAFSTVSSPTSKYCYVAGRGPVLGGLWATRDGGRHWVRRRLPGGWIIDFPARRTGYSVGDGCVYKTTDAGRSWRRQALPIRVDIPAVDFVDVRHGWVVGDAGVILRTTDGGATWKRQYSGTDARLTGVVFVDPMHGWASGVGGDYEYPWDVLLRTRDGGATWQEI
jgi:photosystem II stability/assembly factor-like uncharacterized protein